MTDTNEEKEIEFKIPIDQLYPKFVEHLGIENNSRILFSGKFGIGKTYFLNEFFENNKDEYEVFHLFPINYQISSNKDIIEYLKYDISVELYKKDKNIYQGNDYLNFIDLQSLLYFFAKDNIAEILKTSVSFIPKLGKPLKDIIGLVENFLTSKKELELNDINNFVKEIKEKNISETDYFSELLKEKITEVKGNKQSILILDDLDRIDPEHIFRILNIFSAHFDLHDSNKFSFDKIILVADYLNLRSIFHHKYGSETDFNGYFDKFFSVEVFEFSNNEIIEKVMDEIINEFQKEKSENLNKLFDNPRNFKLFLKEILIKSNFLTSKEKLNLRQLLKGIKFPLKTFNSDLFYTSHFYNEHNLILFGINIGVKSLISIFGGIDEDLLIVLKKIRNQLNTDTKELFDEQYEIFSESLLQYIEPFDSNVTKHWRNYSISILDKQIKKVIDTNNNQQINVAFLFYDLLIKYVENKSYKEKVKFK